MYKPVYLLWVAISVIVLSHSLSGQEGFIRAYDLGYGGVTFHNMLLKDDTLIVIGEVANDTLQQWGVLFMKMDTLGNILQYKTHFDQFGDFYTFEQNYDFIPTYDGGYAAVGQLFARKSPILIKLDVNGELEFVREYPDSTVLSIRHWGVVALQHGYLTLGAKQQAIDGKSNAFIMRTNEQGHKIWEIDYGDYGVHDEFKGITKINENEFLITGATSNGSDAVSSLYDLWGISRAIKVDSSGNIIWEQQGELIYADGSKSSPQKIYSSTDGNWVHTGAHITVFNDTRNGFQGEIVKRDTNFNVIWSTRFGEPTSSLNSLTALTSTPDGGWVAAGNYLVALAYHPQYGYPTEGYRPAWLVKVSSNGDSLWMRLDTIYYHEDVEASHHFSGVVALPSGSIIACGHLNRYSPAPSKSFGCLIKVDKHGCMEPGCNPTTNTENLSPLIFDFDVFPNPVRDNIHIAIPGKFDVHVYDAHGLLLMAKAQAHESLELGMAHLPNGIYFVQVSQGHAKVVKRIIKQ